MGWSGSTPQTFRVWFSAGSSGLFQSTSYGLCKNGKLEVKAFEVKKQRTPGMSHT